MDELTSKDLTAAVMMSTILEGESSSDFQMAQGVMALALEEDTDELYAEIKTMLPLFKQGVDCLNKVINKLEEEKQ